MLWNDYRSWLFAYDFKKQLRTWTVCCTNVHYLICFHSHLHVASVEQSKVQYVMNVKELRQQGYSVEFYMQSSHRQKHNISQQTGNPKPTLFIPLPMMSLDPSAMSFYTWIYWPAPRPWVYMDFESKTRRWTVWLPLHKTAMFVFYYTTLLGSTGMSKNANVINWALTSPGLQERFRHAGSSSGFFWRETSAASSGKWHHSLPPSAQLCFPEVHLQSDYRAVMMI